MKTCIVVRHLSTSEEEVMTENGESGMSAETEDESFGIAKRPTNKLKVYVPVMQTSIIFFIRKHLLV